MADEVYLDSNVVFYSVSVDREFGASCSTILGDVKDGRLRAIASSLIISEIANAMYKTGRARGMERIVAALTSLPIRFYDVTEPIASEGVRLARAAKASPYDGVHAATMSAVGVRTILSADTDFDRFLGVVRVDPRAYGGDGRA